MCNVYNSSYNASTSTCSSGSSCNNCGWSWLDTLFGTTSQSVCRDCNGCLRVRNNTCGCCNCGCNSCNSCGCGNNNGNTSENDNGTGGNGNFACITYCGAVGNNAAVIPAMSSTSSFNADAYYARQYGLYPYNTSSGCNRCSACANAYLSSVYNS